MSKSKRQSLRSTLRLRCFSMSAGVVSGWPRNRVPSDMEAMLWFRTRWDCRARPSSRGAGSWNWAVLSAVEFAVRSPVQRQGGGGRSGGLVAAQLHGSAAALCELRGVQRVPGTALPRTPGRSAWPCSGKASARDVMWRSRLGIPASRFRNWAARIPMPSAFATSAFSESWKRPLRTLRKSGSFRSWKQNQEKADRLQ